MSNQYLKLRRSNVPGKIPTTESIDFGEIALNTYDGRAYMKVSGSSGIKVVPIGFNSGSFNGIFTGEFSGSFSGSGADLFDIPASAIVGLNLSQISSGSYSASISEAGLLVNNRVVAPSFTGSLFGTASWATNALTASFAPNYLPLTGGTINGDVILNGTASIAFLNVTIESASVIYSSGSNVFGDSTQDTQTLVGIVLVSGSQSITGSLNVSQGITGSLLGTSSWAENAITASYVELAQSASYVLNAVSSSFASTASYVENAQTASNILGGKATHVPFFNTDTTLATSSIYQSGSSTVIINQDAATEANPEALYVWQPSTSSFNVISGKGNLDNYLQLNIQNTNQGPDASSDVVATANNGDENSNYVNMGINSQNYAGFLGAPNDAYLYSTGEDLWIGNYSDGKNVYLFNSSSVSPSLTIDPNGQVNVDTVLYSPNTTGSLYGTASWARNAISASHAVNADFAGYAQAAGTAANGGVTQIIAGSGVSLIPSNGVGNVTVIATGVGGVTILSGSNVTQSFVNSSTWNFSHNLGVRTPVISVFDSNYNQVIPESIQLIDTASAIITFPTLESGFAIATVGGVTGNALSSSYSLLATYADTASYYAETDPVFVARSASLATTGSNVFIGTQTITGSLNITGSTTQTGNNTLIGNTVLSGSITVSGSQTFNGTSTSIGTQIVTGSLLTSGSQVLSGNTTLIGSTILSGSFEVSGSTVLHNSTFIVTGSTFINGTTQITGSTGITGSFSVRDGDINIVSGSSFTRWGNKLFNYGQFSDTTTQSGSANTAYAMKFNTTDFALNTRIVSQSRITVDNTGIYNLQFSAQLSNTANTNITFDVWFAYTGSNIANSNTQIDVNKSAGQLGRQVAAWNFAYPIQANDYVEIYWSCNANTGQLVAAPAAVTPTRPAIPSVIATLTQIA